MGFSLFPKEMNFFNLLEKQADGAIEAAVYFKELVSGGKFDESVLQKMRDIEHHADDVFHEMIRQLNLTFITPFDREDIHALASEMDDIVDVLKSISNRLKVYGLSGVNKDLIQFATMIEESVRALRSVVGSLRDVKQHQEALRACTEIYRFENDGDNLRDDLLAKLFTEEKDPVNIIKWKDIFQDTARVLDIAEDVANIVESIFVKHA
jgi:hypothetical protein